MSVVDLEHIKARHEDQYEEFIYRSRLEPTVDYEMALYASIKDVGTLLAEVERLNATLDGARTQAAEDIGVLKAEVERGRGELMNTQQAATLWINKCEDEESAHGATQERLRTIEAAAREMRDYITLRDVATMDGGVRSAEEKLKRWDDALAGQGAGAQKPADSAVDATPNTL